MNPEWQCTRVVSLQWLRQTDLGVSWALSCRARKASHLFCVSEVMPMCWALQGVQCLSVYTDTIPASPDGFLHRSVCVGLGGTPGSDRAEFCPQLT